MRFVEPILHSKNSPSLTRKLRQFLKPKRVCGSYPSRFEYQPAMFTLARKSLRLSQEQLAEILKVPANVVSCWETPTDEPLHLPIPSDVCKLMSFYLDGFRHEGWPSDILAAEREELRQHST